MATAGHLVHYFRELQARGRSKLLTAARKGDFSSFPMPDNMDSAAVAALCNDERHQDAVLTLHQMIVAEILIELSTVMEQGAWIGGSDGQLVFLWDEQRVPLTGLRDELWDRLVEEPQP